MADDKSGVVIKNTFLEVADRTSQQRCTEDGWRRQMSEPVKFQGKAALAGLDSDFDDDDDLELGPPQPSMQYPAAPLLAGPAEMSGPSSSVFSMPAFHPMQAAPQGSYAPGQEVYADIPDGAARAPKPGLQGGGPKLQANAPREQGKQQRQPRLPQSQGGANYGNNEDITKKEPPWQDVTTVMMRNLPNKYRQQMLVDELQDAGFRLQADFDFFYLPMDHSNAANLGYCFINFVEPHMANAFAAAFQGKKMRRFNSNKTVVVMPASIQGYERNYRYYSSTRVAKAEDPAYRPLFLKQGHVEIQEDRKGGGKGGKGLEKGRGKKGNDKGAGYKAGKGLEAFGSLAFMGLDSPMDSMNQPQALQSPPILMGGQMPSMGSNLIPCMHCGNLCNPDHRFCSSCGNIVQQRGPPRQPGSGRAGGQVPVRPTMDLDMAGGMFWPGQEMRADAPSFMPNGAQAGPCQRNPHARSAPGPPPGQQLGDFSQFSDSVTNELDVMRGRLMLIAALKDIEQRDSGCGQPPRGDPGMARPRMPGMGGFQPNFQGGR